MTEYDKDQRAQRLHDLQLAVKARIETANARRDQDDLITSNTMLDLVNASLRCRAAKEAADVTIPLLDMTLHRRGNERLSSILSVDTALSLALKVVHHLAEMPSRKAAA